MDIKQLQIEAYATAEEKGFHHQVPPRTVGDQLMWACSELGEAFSAFQKTRMPASVYYDEHGKPDGMPIELADALIIIADLAQELKIDLSAALEAKMAYNKTRPPKHGKII